MHRFRINFMGFRNCAIFYWIFWCNFEEKVFLLCFLSDPGIPGPISDPGIPGPNLTDVTLVDEDTKSIGQFKC